MKTPEPEGPGASSTQSIADARTVREALRCGKSGCECARPRGKVHCPAHPDVEHPNLNVSGADNGKLLTHCFAGCPQTTVIAALQERGVWQQPQKRARPRVTRYQIKNLKGELVAIHERTDRPNGDKTLIWRRPDGSLGLDGTPVGALPLYGSELLASAPPGAVVVVEGEKGADALNRRGVLAVGTVTGAAGTPDLNALTVLLPHRVILWPDNDDAGRQHMARVAGSLLAMGHRDVRTVEWPDAPDKGDAADFTGSDDELKALLAAARPYEPPPPVDLAALLDDVRALMRRYVVLDDAQADAVALWTSHTHAFDAAECTPYLSVTSAEKRSGKSLLLESLSSLVARPWLTGRVTAAALYRRIDAERPTLLLDESDSAFRSGEEYAEGLRGVLNTGHRRGGSTTVCVGQGVAMTYGVFSTFSPKAIAGIGRLPDTVADRAIAIVLKRKAPGETVARFKWRRAQEEGAPLREKLAAWASRAVDTLRDAGPTIPDELDDRAADGWEPLLAIADAAGGEWPDRARRAALALSVGDAREDDSLGVRLLRDIRAVFDGRGTGRLPSGDLAAALGEIEEAPWGDLKGKPLDARRLAWWLRPYGVRPRTIRLGDDSTAKGYQADWFTDAWARYAPSPPPPGEPSQASQASKVPDTDRGEVTDVTDATANPGVVNNGEYRDACADCGGAVDFYAEEGTPYYPRHGLRPTDGPLVRYAVEQLGLLIVGRQPAVPRKESGP